MRPTNTNDPKDHPDSWYYYRIGNGQGCQVYPQAKISNITSINADNKPRTKNVLLRRNHPATINYIISRKDKIFDSGNIKLALVAQDPLGEAFKVKAFHRCQVKNLLQSQLIPVIAGRLAEIRTEKYYGSPGVRVTTKDI